MSHATEKVSRCWIYLGEIEDVVFRHLSEAVRFHPRPFSRFQLFFRAARFLRTCAGVRSCPLWACSLQKPQPLADDFLGRLKIPRLDLVADKIFKRTGQAHGHWVTLPTRQDRVNYLADPVKCENPV